MRTCAFCGTKRPLSELAEWATSLACADTGACEQRARSSALYPMREDELAVAGREIRAGAIAWH